MIDVGVDKRTKNNALQSRKSSWKNSVFVKIEIVFDLQPIDKPQKPHKKKWQCNNRVGIFELVVAHVQFKSSDFRFTQKCIQKQFNAILSYLNLKPFFNAPP